MSNQLELAKRRLKMQKPTQQNTWKGGWSNEPFGGSPNVLYTITHENNTDKINFSFANEDKDKLFGRIIANVGNDTIRVVTPTDDLFKHLEASRQYVFSGLVFDERLQKQLVSTVVTNTRTGQSSTVSPLSIKAYNESKIKNVINELFPNSANNTAVAVLFTQLEKEGFINAEVDGETVKAANYKSTMVKVITPEKFATGSFHENAIFSLVPSMVKTTTSNGFKRNVGAEINRVIVWNSENGLPKAFIASNEEEMTKLHDLFNEKARIVDYFLNTPEDDESMQKMYEVACENESNIAYAPCFALAIAVPSEQGKHTLIYVKNAFGYLDVFDTIKYPQEKLDENGNVIIGEDGFPVFETVKRKDSDGVEHEDIVMKKGTNGYDLYFTMNPIDIDCQIDLFIEEINAAVEGDEIYEAISKYAPDLIGNITKDNIVVFSGKSYQSGLNRGDQASKIIDLLKSYRNNMKEIVDDNTMTNQQRAAHWDEYIKNDISIQDKPHNLLVKQFAAFDYNGNIIVPTDAMGNQKHKWEIKSALTAYKASPLEQFESRVIGALNVYRGFVSTSSVYYNPETVSYSFYATAKAAIPQTWKAENLLAVATLVDESGHETKLTIPAIMNEGTVIERFGRKREADETEQTQTDDVEKTVNDAKAQYQAPDMNSDSNMPVVEPTSSPNANIDDDIPF